MSHKTLAEKFAQGATKGKAGNTFVDGKNLYSYGYHFIIATRIAPKEFAVTTRKFSYSTSRQVSIVRRALVASGAVVTDVEIYN